jgi:hypothetical protein
MAKFTIHWMQPALHAGDTQEEVEADYYQDAGDWIDFYGEEGESDVKKLRVRAGEVQRIDRS